MNVFRITFNRPLIFLSFLIATTLSPGLAAQEGEEGGLVRIYEIILKPDMVDEWTALQRDEAIPALLASGYAWVDVWRSGGAGNAYYRSIIVPIDSLSAMDEPSSYTRVLGAEKARDLVERTNAMVSSMTTLIVRTRQDLSFGSPPETPGIGVLATVTVANGRTEEFERRLRSSVASELQESNVRSFRVSQVLYGGDANQYFTLLEFDSFEDDDVVRSSPVTGGHPSTLEWALGTVGVSRVAEEPNSPVTSINRVVLRHDDELSSR